MVLFFELGQKIRCILPTINFSYDTILKSLTLSKNPFSLDTKEPNRENFYNFLLREVRYYSVKKAYSDEAENFSQRHIRLLNSAT